VKCRLRGVRASIPFYWRGPRNEKRGGEDRRRKKRCVFLILRLLKLWERRPEGGIRKNSVLPLPISTWKSNGGKRKRKETSSLLCTILLQHLLLAAVGPEEKKGVPKKDGGKNCPLLSTTIFSASGLSLEEGKRKRKEKRASLVETRKI